jgi:hypothetical protein
MSEWVEDDYPTDAALKRIEQWPYQDIAGCLDFVASIWHWPDFGVSHELRDEEWRIVRAKPGERYLRLATGGWSGNEEIVAAIKTNYMLRALAWRLTARGGLHIFQYPESDHKDASHSSAVPVTKETR